MVVWGVVDPPEPVCLVSCHSPLVWEIEVGGQRGAWGYGRQDGRALDCCCLQHSEGVVRGAGGEGAVGNVQVRSVLVTFWGELWVGFSSVWVEKVFVVWRQLPVAEQPPLPPLSSVSSFSTSLSASVVV